MHYSESVINIFDSVFDNHPNSLASSKLTWHETGHRFAHLVTWPSITELRKTTANNYGRLSKAFRRKLFALTSGLGQHQQAIKYVNELHVYIDFVSFLGGTCW